MMFHGLFGNAEALGYLLILHVVALAHEKDLPAFVGQAIFFYVNIFQFFLFRLNLKANDKIA